MSTFSTHAQRRAAQRFIGDETVELVLEWGAPLRQPGGRVAWFLGDREAAAARADGVSVPERAIGVAVVVAADGGVVTVLKSHDRKRLAAHGRSGRRRRAS